MVGGFLGVRGLIDSIITEYHYWFQLRHNECYCHPMKLLICDEAMGGPQDYQSTWDSVVRIRSLLLYKKKLKLKRRWLPRPRRNTRLGRINCKLHVANFYVSMIECGRLCGFRMETDKFFHWQTIHKKHGYRSALIWKSPKSSRPSRKWSTSAASPPAERWDKLWLWFTTTNVFWSDGTQTLQPTKGGDIIADPAFLFVLIKSPGFLAKLIDSHLITDFKRILDGIWHGPAQDTYWVRCAARRISWFPSTTVVIHRFS